jgi:hypothetical protein
MFILFEILVFTEILNYFEYSVYGLQATTRNMRRAFFQIYANLSQKKERYTLVQIDSKTRNKKKA